jgi:Flp pilus assembly protein TadD
MEITQGFVVMDDTYKERPIAEGKWSGRNRFVLGKNEAALRSFEWVLNLYSDDGEINSLAAVCLFRLGRTEEANALAKRGGWKGLIHDPLPYDLCGHEGGPKEISTIFLSLESLSILEQPCMDEPELHKSPAPDEKNGSAHISTGKECALRGEYERAREHFERALEFSTDDGEAHLLRGLCLGQAGRYDEAVCELQQANDLLPDDDRASTYLGVICVYLGARLSTTPPRLAQEKRAVEMLRHAVGINRENRYAQRHLVYAESGLQRTSRVFADLNSTAPPTW